MKCERCPSNCILCPANYPWNEEFWICEECGSTYIYEWDRNTYIQGKLKVKVEGELDAT